MPRKNAAIGVDGEQAVWGGAVENDLRLVQRLKATPVDQGRSCAYCARCSTRLPAVQAASASPRDCKVVLAPSGVPAGKSCVVTPPAANAASIASRTRVSIGVEKNCALLSSLVVARM